MTVRTSDSPGSGACPDPLMSTFDLTVMSHLRRCTADHARAYGLHGPDLDGFVLAVNEIMANVVTHGGGQGHLYLWAEGDRVRCRISDSGPGIAGATPSTHRPPPQSSGGRGLWMAGQLCDLDIRTGPRGTTVELVAPAESDPP